MIAIVKESATPEQLDHFITWIEGRGYKTNVSRGDNETIVGIIGDTTQIDPFLLESMDIIERVQRVSEPFKKANRKFHPEDTVIDCGHGCLIGGGHFQVMAGPCSVEGKNLIEIARQVKQAGATMLRGGAYKPRTSPYSFQGMGERGLDLLLEASADTGMPVVTEIMDPRDVQLFVDKRIDVMQIGARNAQNFPLLKEVGKTDIPILLKRGIAGTVDELLMAAEYTVSAALRRVHATPSISMPFPSCTTSRTCPWWVTRVMRRATPAMCVPQPMQRRRRAPTASRSRFTTSPPRPGPTARRH